MIDDLVDYFSGIQAYLTAQVPDGAEQTSYGSRSRISRCYSEYKILLIGCYRYKHIVCTAEISESADVW